MTPVSTMAEHVLRPLPIEIDVGRRVWAVTFSANGKHLLSGDDNGVRIWRVKDGTLVTAMDTVLTINCITVSDDGKWIAAGAYWGHLFIWATKTYEQIFTHKEDSNNIRGVDYSPDSTRLVTASANCRATVWDVADCTQVLMLPHRYGVRAAKYSPQGNLIATATPYSIQVWDNNNGNLLAAINVKVTLWYNKGLLWSNDHLFVVSGDTMRKLDASKWSTVSEWAISNTNDHPCIVLPKHGQFSIYATNGTVTFRDMSSHAPLPGAVPRPRGTHLIALSSDDQLLATCGETGRITIERISRLTSALQEPNIHVDDATLSSWKLDQLENAEASLTGTITGSKNPNHDVLIYRAFIRTRLRKWAAALADAEMAIKIQPSFLGYIAKSLAHVGNGEKDKGYQFCDSAFAHSDSSYVDFIHLFKAIIMSIAGEHVEAMSCMENMVGSYSICAVVQAYMHFRHGNSQIESKNYEGAIQSFKHALAEIPPFQSQPLSVVSLISGWKFDNLGVTVQQRLCEAFYLAGCTQDADESLLGLVTTFEKEVYKNMALVGWVSDFTQKCLSVPASDAELAPRTSETPLLKVWVKVTLASRTWKDALLAAVGFVTPRPTIYQTICEYLEEIGQMTDVYKCLLEMVNELAQQTDESTKWIIDAKHWCGGKLEDLGDYAMKDRQHDEAIDKYSTALFLHPPSPQVLLAKRSKARANMGLWEDALNDADQIILADPASPSGYERKHAALRGAGRLPDANDVFEAMLSKMSESADAEIRERSRRYIRPSETESAIRVAIQDVIRESPLVLIDTNSGRLLDKQEQASSFESQLIYHELVSSMTTEINHTRIEDEVAHYYRYAMFSHRWEGREPLFKDVMGKAVHELERTQTQNKLERFCTTVREAGLNWAWSDTCCINQEDLAVLQESLVAMFRWYHGSALTVVYLLDAPLLRLVDSVWNSRVWTFQEYHASKVVRFFNKDWSTYKNLDIPNHKESPEIIAEMETATGISARALTELEPGLDDIREKLRLASTRQATRAEDIAYSLFGIFSTLLPIQYGEGNRALGRLLARLLTSSGDTTILAWTGASGSFNSCLPAKISVFKDLPTSHIPPTIAGSDTETGIQVNLNSAMKLYDQLHNLPLPLFVEARLKLSCLAFKLGQVVAVSRDLSERVFHAKAEALGMVEIKTTEDISRLASLTLVHPWIDFLLDRQPVARGRDIEALLENNTELSSFTYPSHVPPRGRAGWLTSRLGLSIGARRREDRTTLQAPPRVSLTDKRTEALHLVARLRQPFGALLLTQRRHNVPEYRRVASESLITVQVQRDTSLNVLIDCAKMVEIL